MKRMLALGAVLFVAGCGEGPKHIPKADYQHGKAAFEMLQQYEKTSSNSFSQAADQQIDAISSQHMDNGLFSALLGYNVAIGERLSARLRLTSAEESKQTKATKAIQEIEPIIKLCRDDAAQYFDAAAASTNTCNAALTAYRAKYKPS